MQLTVMEYSSYQQNTDFLFTPNSKLVLFLPSNTTITLYINIAFLFLCKYTLRILFNTFALYVHVVTIITC